MVRKVFIEKRMTMIAPENTFSTVSYLLLRGCAQRNTSKNRDYGSEIFAAYCNSKFETHKWVLPGKIT